MRAAGGTVRRRQPKQDAVLAQAVDLARAAVVDAADGEANVGEHLSAQAHEDRLLTHLFECTLPGYRGWTWFATVARAPRTKLVTVCEVGLLAGKDSLLAPEWVPWEERLQAVKDQEAAEEHSGATAVDDSPSGEADLNAADGATSDDEFHGTGPHEVGTDETGRAQDSPEWGVEVVFRAPLGGAEDAENSAGESS